MSAIDQPSAPNSHEFTPEELLRRQKSILSTEVFKLLNHSPKKALTPEGAPRAMKSLAKMLAKVGITAADEEVKNYLLTGALADAEIGIGWDGEKYLLVTPGEEMPVPKVEVAQAPAPKEEVVSVEPEEAPVVEQIKESPFPEWERLHEIDAESKLAILRAMYEYLKLDAGANFGRNWYLAPEVVRTFPTQYRQIIDAHPELVGYDGEPGTFGGFLVALNIAAKYDTEQKFTDHIKLKPGFRPKSVSFNEALRTVMNPAKKRQAALLAYVLNTTDVSDESRPEIGDEKYIDYVSDKDGMKVKSEKVSNKDERAPRAPKESRKRVKQTALESGVSPEQAREDSPEDAAAQSERLDQRIVELEELAESTRTSEQDVELLNLKARRIEAGFNQLEASSEAQSVEHYAKLLSLTIKANGKLLDDMRRVYEKIFSKEKDVEAAVSRFGNSVFTKEEAVVGWLCAEATRIITRPGLTRDTKLDLNSVLTRLELEQRGYRDSFPAFFPDSITAQKSKSQLPDFMRPVKAEAVEAKESFDIILSGKQDMGRVESMSDEDVFKSTLQKLRAFFSSNQDMNTLDSSDRTTVIQMIQKLKEKGELLYSKDKRMKALRQVAGAANGGSIPPKEKVAAMLESFA